MRLSSGNNIMNRREGWGEEVLPATADDEVFQDVVFRLVIRVETASVTSPSVVLANKRVEARG
jgi:hypothetical protein